MFERHSKILSLIKPVEQKIVAGTLSYFNFNFIFSRVSQSASEESREKFAPRIFTPVVISGCCKRQWIYAARILKLLMRNGSNGKRRELNCCAPENPGRKFRLYSEALTFLVLFGSSQKGLKTGAACGPPMVWRNFPGIFNAAYLTSLLMLVASLTFSQTKPKQEGKLINLKHADEVSYDQRYSDAQVLHGHVVFEHDGSLLNCDTALFFQKDNKLQASGHILITKGDSITVTGDKLEYDGKTKMATMQNNVKCVEKDMTLTTNLLNFDVGNSIANYYEGGKIVNKENTLESKNGHYYSATKELAFHYDVVLTNPDYKMKSDTLRYNTHTKTAFFLGPSIILSKENYIYCENGWYDTDKERAQFSKNAVLVTKHQKLTGDSLFYDRNAKLGRAFRNIRLIDTTYKSIISGDYVQFFEKNSEATVTRKATYARIIEDDTLFIAADTLYHRDIDSVDKFLNAYHLVRLYKKDLQALCDSAALNTKDSLMQLFRSPVLWASRSQATAKLIKVNIGRNTIHGFRLEGNSFMINEADTFGKYNQMVGKTIDGFLTRDSLRKVVIVGNAEIYYYPKNKEKIVGLNKTTSNEITIWLKNGEIERASFKPKTSGTIDPIKDVDVENAKLKGFNWQYERRPKSTADLHSGRKEPPLIIKDPEQEKEKEKKKPATRIKRRR